MKSSQNRPPASRRGSALVLALIFITMFSALAVAVASMSGTNVQIVANLQKLNRARAAAESGLEVMRYWISPLAMSGTIPPEQRFSLFAGKLATALSGAGATNIVPVASGSTITISEVPLNTDGQTFSVVLSKIDDDNVRLDVTGHCGS